jgi:hypothetical protein
MADMIGVPAGRMGSPTFTVLEGRRFDFCRHGIVMSGRRSLIKGYLSVLQGSRVHVFGLSCGEN